MPSVRLGFTPEKAPKKPIEPAASPSGGRGFFHSLRRTSLIEPRRNSRNNRSAGGGRASGWSVHRRYFRRSPLWDGGQIPEVGGECHDFRRVLDRRQSKLTTDAGGICKRGETCFAARGKIIADRPGCGALYLQPAILVSRLSLPEHFPCRPSPSQLKSPRASLPR